MGKPRSFFSRGRKVQTVDRLVLEQQAAGFALQNAGSPDGSTWVVDGRELRNFGSCSYMGLARHPALAAAQIELVDASDRELRLRHALASIEPVYDVILVDSPPSLGLLTINALAAADGLLVPVQCEYLALEGLSQLVEIIDAVREQLNPRLELIGVLLTMHDSRTNLSLQVANEVRRHFPAATFQTEIPRSVRLSEAPSFGRPIKQYEPSSRGARAYAALTDELLRRLGMADQIVAAGA